MAGAIIQITVLLTGLVAADAGAPSNDHAKTPTRAEVESALAKEGGPGALQRWAATADGILTVVAADRAASETVRGRALSALAYARTSRAHAFLENFIVEKTPSSAPVDRVLLRRAAASLGWQGGPRVVEVVAPLLDHATPTCVSTRRRPWGWRARARPRRRCARGWPSSPTPASGVRSRPRSSP